MREPVNYLVQYLHFTDKENESQKEELVKDTLLVSNKTRIRSQTPDHSLSVSFPIACKKIGEKDVLGLSPTETHFRCEHVWK